MTKKQSMKVDTLIKGVSIKIEDKELGTSLFFAVPKPARLSDAIDKFYITFNRLPSDVGNVTEGYYISNNTFLSKEDAHRMAIYHGLKNVPLTQFSSDNLW